MMHIGSLLKNEVQSWAVQHNRVAQLCVIGGKQSGLMDDAARQRNQFMLP